eukprot:Em0001g489a
MQRKLTVLCLFRDSVIKRCDFRETNEFLFLVPSPKIILGRRPLGSPSALQGRSRKEEGLRPIPKRRRPLYATATRPIPKRRRPLYATTTRPIPKSRRPLYATTTRPIPKRRRPLHKADPEKKKASVRDNYKADPEKKKASVRDSYNADIESKQSAKRQRYQEDVEDNRAVKRQKYETIQLPLRHLKGIGIGMTPLSDWLNVLPRGSGIAGVTELPLPLKGMSWHVVLH